MVNSLSETAVGTRLINTPRGFLLERRFHSGPVAETEARDNKQPQGAAVDRQALDVLNQGRAAWKSRSSAVTEK